jgi:hypothetical protein
VLAGIEWENVNIAGAFIIGAVLATVATIRIVRAVSIMLRDEQHKHRDDN